jgi:hypothetical protein
LSAQTVCACRFLGSARVSRVGDGVLAIVDFRVVRLIPESATSRLEDRFGVTPKPARETRALPNMPATAELDR